MAQRLGYNFMEHGNVSIELWMHVHMTDLNHRLTGFVTVINIFCSWYTGKYHSDSRPILHWADFRKQIPYSEQQMPFAIPLFRKKCSEAVQLAWSGWVFSHSQEEERPCKWGCNAIPYGVSQSNGAWYNSLQYPFRLANFGWPGMNLIG